MSMEIKHLKWDSQNFGFHVGEYIVDESETWSVEQLKLKAKQERYRLVYLKSQYQIAENSLFHDERVVLAKNNENLQNLEHPNVLNYTSQDIEQKVYDLALGSGEYSRYKLDKDFPEESFQLLYRRWIENSILTDYATGVIVYKENKDIVGLLTYKNTQKCSTIGLIAVDPNYQNHGIGSILIKHYQSLLDDKIETLDVVTQGGNKNAIAFYEKNGYHIQSKTYTYHLWI